MRLHGPSAAWVRALDTRPIRITSVPLQQMRIRCDAGGARSHVSFLAPLVTMAVLQGCSSASERSHRRAGVEERRPTQTNAFPEGKSLSPSLTRLTYSEWKVGRGGLSRFRVRGLRPSGQADNWIEEPTRVQMLIDSLEGVLYDPKVQLLRSSAYEELEVEFASGEMRAVKLHINPPAKVWSLVFEGEGTLYCDARIEALLRSVYDLPPAYVSGSLRSGDDE